MAFVNPVVTFMSIIYGSDCPSKDESVALVLPVANSEAMSLHFEEILKKTEPGRVAVVIMDQPGWHTSLRPSSNSLIT